MKENPDVNARGLTPFISFILFLSAFFLGAECRAEDERWFASSVSNGVLKLVIHGVEGLEVSDYGEVNPVILYVRDETRQGFLKLYEANLSRIFLFSSVKNKYRIVQGDKLEINIPLVNLEPKGFFDLKSGELVGFSEKRHEEFDILLKNDLSAIELLNKNRIGIIIFRKNVAHPKK